MPTPATITSGLGSPAAERTSSLAQALGSLMDRLGLRLSLQTLSRPDAAGSLEFSRLEAEVLRLHRERAQITAENQLLNEIIGRSAPAGAARLLRRMIPQPTEGLAAVIDVSTSARTTLAVRGASFDSPLKNVARTPRPSESQRENTDEASVLREYQQAVDPDIGISISDQTMEQLQREPLLIRTFEIHSISGGGPATITVHDSLPTNSFGRGTFDREPTAELFLVPIKDDDRLVGILATTALWPGGLRRSDQVEILGRLGQTILRRFLQERHQEQHQTELWLAQEMLRLKSITDRATDQPLETLGEFAARLCEATEMDRAALFLASRRAGDVAAPTVEAGTQLTPTITVEWRKHETQLANACMTAPRGEVFDKPRLEQMGVDTLLGRAIACPVLLAAEPLGALVLSRRNHDALPAKTVRLIEWSAELLAQTLQRIYRDAAIRRQARHDGLTDLANRRTFDTLLAGEIDRVRLGLSEECSLLLADLDRFKLINDHHGHQAGDEVLRAIARSLREQVGRMRMGERSLLARYGGEELAILLPGVGTAGALRVAEELRAAIECLAIVFGDKRLGVTVSIGVASCPLHGMGSTELVEAADAALYRAKSEGRNRVCRPMDSPR